MSYVVWTYKVEMLWREHQYPHTEGVILHLNETFHGIAQTYTKIIQNIMPCLQAVVRVCHKIK